MFTCEVEKGLPSTKLSCLFYYYIVGAEIIIGMTFKGGFVIERVFCCLDFTPLVLHRIEIMKKCL